MGIWTGFLLPLFPSPSIFLDHPSTWTRPPLQIQRGLYYLKECFLFPPVADMTPHHSPNQTPTCLFGHWLLPRFLWSPFSSGNCLLGFLLDFTAAAAFSATIQEPRETLESRSAGVSSEGIELWGSSCVAETTAPPPCLYSPNQCTHAQLSNAGTFMYMYCFLWDARVGRVSTP